MSTELDPLDMDLGEAAIKAMPVKGVAYTLPGLEVEVERRPGAASETWIDQKLLEFAMSIGARLSWTPAHPDNLSKKYGEGIFPLRVADLPTKWSVDKDGQSLDLKEQVERAHFINAEGYVCAGDSCIVYQSLGVFGARQHRFEEYRSRQENPQTQREQLESALEGAARATGHSNLADILTVQDDPAPRDNVFVNKNTARLPG